MLADSAPHVTPSLPLRRLEEICIRVLALHGKPLRHVHARLGRDDAPLHFIEHTLLGRQTGS